MMENEFKGKTPMQNARKSVGMSRAELSRITGISIRTLENWEAGSSKPGDPKKLQLIADTLGVDIKILIE